MARIVRIGVEFFERIIENDYFYVDKTLFIKEFLEKRGDVTLITRPRRFGKTLNMHMMKEFFDITKDTKAMFSGLKITKHQDIINKHQNQYPVIYITLKNVESKTYPDAVNNIKRLMSELYRDNNYLLKSKKLDKNQKASFNSYIMTTSTEDELKNSLQFLTKCFFTHHQKKTVVLIDEYDTPLNNSVFENYYPDMIKFMRGFLGDVFKGNVFLEFGLLTGVQRIAKESLMSSFNNPMVNGIMDKDFPTCFGFTEDEVKAACEEFDVSCDFEEVKNWYNGYRFGDNDMYNPWSITGFLHAKEIKNFWVNTGGTQLMENMIQHGSMLLRNSLAGLLTGTPIQMKYNSNIIYPIDYKNINAFWSIMLNTGYLKPCAGATGREFLAELVNNEVHDMFEECISRWFDEPNMYSVYESIREFVDCLFNGDAEGVSRLLNEELLNYPSFHDYKEENSYHMFIFGMLLAASSRKFLHKQYYNVYSNRESGKGRSDCLIKPVDKNNYAVIIEFKHLKNSPLPPSERGAASPPSLRGAGGSHLQNIAEEGLKQIEEMSYIHTLKQEGYEKVYKFSIAFYKKTCAVAFSTD